MNNQDDINEVINFLNNNPDFIKNEGYGDAAITYIDKKGKNIVDIFIPNDKDGLPHYCLSRFIDYHNDSNNPIFTTCNAKLCIIKEWIKSTDQQLKEKAKEKEKFWKPVRKIDPTFNKVITMEEVK